jgi:hypothetical protein
VHAELRETFAEVGLPVEPWLELSTCELEVRPEENCPTPALEAVPVTLEPTGLLVLSCTEFSGTVSVLPSTE